MSPIGKVALFLALVSLSCTALARDLPSLEERLAAGLSDGGGLVDCWNALMEIKSCSNEIVMFFMNGESYLGPDCCRAIGVITHHCWASMLSSLGFTAKESDILRGYCDAEAISPTASSPPSPPNPAPAASVGADATALPAEFSTA